VDSCKGALLATMPLGTAYHKNGVVTLPTADVKGTGGIRSRSKRTTAGAKSLAGLQVDQARRLKELEQENGKLRRLVAELSLDKLVLMDIASGNF
jgi:hypothetical protein